MHPGDGNACSKIKDEDVGVKSRVGEEERMRNLSTTKWNKAFTSRFMESVLFE